MLRIGRRGRGAGDGHNFEPFQEVVESLLEIFRGDAIGRGQVEVFKQSCLAGRDAPDGDLSCRPGGEVAKAKSVCQRNPFSDNLIIDNVTAAGSYSLPAGCHD